LTVATRRHVRLALAVVTLYAVCCCLVFFTAAHRDMAWFVHFGKEGTELPLAYKILGPHVRVPLKDGQDGETFWVLGRDPLLLHAHQTAAALDRPAYRAQRIAYPMLAAPWRLAFGEGGLLWGLLITNLVAVGIGTTFAAALGDDLGAPAWAGLVFGLTPAVVLATGFDMSDVVACAGVIGLVLFVRRRQLGPAIACGALAALAKEPSLLAVGALALLARDLRLRARVVLAAVPGLLVAAWGVYERWRLGWPSTSIQEFTGPLYGYVDAYRRAWRPAHTWGDALIAVLIGALAVGIVVAWWRDRGSVVLIAALPYAVLVPFLSAQVLDLQTNSWRAIGPAVTLLILYGAARSVTADSSAAAVSSPT
jgi:hypothetical protein